MTPKWRCFGVIDFFLDIVPPRVTHQEKKVVVVNGKPRFYEPQPLKLARKICMLSLAPHRPPEPISGALKLTVRWQFPRGAAPGGVQDHPARVCALCKLCNLAKQRLSQCCRYG